jgi:ferredoxin
MRDVDERDVAGWRVRIDRLLCVGFGDCVTAAPDAFRLDDEGIAEFVEPCTIERERLITACEACPVDALTIWDADGNQVVP